MEKLLAAVNRTLPQLTLTRTILLVLVLAALTAAYIAITNSKNVYEDFNARVLKINSDLPLTAPGVDGQALIARYLMNNPNVALVTVIDADPIRNLRTPVYRAWGSEQLRRIVEAARDQGQTGQGPLWNANEKNNRQMISILNGEFSCEPLENGLFYQLYPQSREVVKYSCRIPLPPAFNAATGWISVHLKEYPPPMGIDEFKYASLRMSMDYFNAEIAGKK